MRSALRVGLIGMVLAVGGAATSAAGPFEDGVAAYGRQDL